MQPLIPEKNNFDFVRFCLALTVCLVHAAQLSDRIELAFITQLLSSEIAVQSFFSISGFLIVMSYERSSSVKSYFEKRGRRIFPAYFTAIFLCATLLATQSTAEDFFFSRPWWAYLAANLSFLNFLHPDLPGVFSENRITAVNGALWTLKIELVFYLVVPVLCWAIRRVGALWVIVGLYVASSIYSALVQGSLQHQLPGQLRFFIAGTACYYGMPLLQKYRHQIVTTAVVVIVARAVPNVKLAYPLAIAVLTISAALFRHLGDFGRHGDFSYGIYIIHFPIIQIMVSKGYFDRAPMISLAALVLMVLTGAFLMWNLIESRWLKRHSPNLCQSVALRP